MLACFWLCFVTCFFEEFSCFSFCASERLSVASQPASFIFFSFLLFERVLFLAEPSDLFGSQGYLCHVVALWNECVSVHPLTLSDPKFSLAMGSPFGPSLGLVAIRSPFFFLGLFHLCPSTVALAPSSLWICVSWLGSIVCFG